MVIQHLSISNIKKRKKKSSFLEGKETIIDVMI